MLISWCIVYSYSTHINYVVRCLFWTRLYPTIIIYYFLFLFRAALGAAPGHASLCAAVRFLVDNSCSNKNKCPELYQKSYPNLGRCSSHFAMLTHAVTHTNLLLVVGWRNSYNSNTSEFALLFKMCCKELCIGEVL